MVDVVVQVRSFGRVTGSLRVSCATKDSDAFGSSLTTMVCGTNKNATYPLFFFGDVEFNRIVVCLLR